MKWHGCGKLVWHLYLKWFALNNSVSQGIGKATAILLAECGANVIALSRTQSDLDSLKSQVMNDLLGLLYALKMQLYMTNFCIFI